MKELVHQILFRALGSIRRTPATLQSPRGAAARLPEALERVVEGTDPGIRFVRGYGKKLRTGITTSLEYAEQLVTDIPRPIEVSRRTFVSDPYVNAFFTNVDDLQTVFSRSSEIRDFMDDVSQQAMPHCCALLCMHKSERTVMGMELEGEMLKTDVQQLAVSFSDHRIYAPAPDETGAREGLKQCLFEGLVTHALARIMRLKVMNRELQHRHQMLHARLRHLLVKTCGAGRHGRPDAAAAREVEDTRQELRKVEEQLLNAQPPSPQELLNQVNAVFSRPDNFIRTRKSSLILNKMGIKIDANSSQPSNKLDLTEVIIGDEQPRVVTLATFPRDELRIHAEFMARRMLA
jgi:hypothetical protein